LPRTRMSPGGWRPSTRSMRWTSRRSCPATDRSAARRSWRTGEYFGVLMREAKKRFEAGMSPGQAAADIRLGKFDNWIGPEQIVMNVVRLYHHFNSTV